MKRLANEIRCIGVSDVCRTKAGYGDRRVATDLTKQLPLSRQPLHRLTVVPDRLHIMLEW